MTDLSLFWHSESIEEELELKRRQIIAGRFKLICPLGEGGFGQVWRVKDLWLNNEVALKISQDDLTRETLLLRKLPKNQYVSIFDYVKDDVLQIAAYSMEILDSPWATLERFYENRIEPNLNNGNFAQPLRLTLHIAIDILMALQVLHGQRYGRQDRWCHADIKPQNLYINETAAANAITYCWNKDFIRIAKVGDLGLARESGSRLSGGTYNYMAPEQNGTRNVSAATDIFAVGQTIAALICGSPFDENDLAHVNRMSHQLRTQIDSDYLTRRLLQPLRRMTLRAPIQRANSDYAIRMLRGVVESEDDWHIIGLFECTRFTINEAAEALFLQLAPKRNWTNRTCERIEEMKMLVRNARRRGLLILDGHTYRL
ncbi:protein kinase domain-containing protein [Methylotuvimicrobium alcaliphilum]|uniref:Mitogen-activated protein kinase kinase n=1 Tax=Methylotuvimicrobium alcaliphilum (strain DSM 19304 / NCIMB 14124 / VKM B-2133 / 20Z) TaxID=1091494 RepID=G4T1N8_META2|nr:protein kinase [Methylotuvimicrobium alcaliphilum]CCE23470.1 putative Mitogen-activated protein kinase kinase [Methylotuvimicrobium alcaliphilum 20Z]